MKVGKSVRVLGILWLMTGCAVVSKEPVTMAAKVTTPTQPVAAPIIPAMRPVTDKNDELSLALNQLIQDAQLGLPERDELFKSLVLQPLPVETLDGLRQVQLLLLKHQPTATQNALGVLRSLTLQGREEGAKPDAPLVAWFTQWAKEQAAQEADKEQLMHLNLQLQGRYDNLLRQIQELQAIEHRLSSRPGSNYGGTGKN